MIYYYHGSADSTDIDIMYILDQPISREDASRLCSDNTEVNKNVCCVQNGQVVYCYKGSIDEVNNALMDTYSLHKQDHPMVITKRVERNVQMKTIRVMRGVISWCSRTDLRSQVKQILHVNDWKQRVTFIQEHDLYKLNDYGKHDKVEVRKFFAFQLGQLCGLLENKELYTKHDMAVFYPDLKQYLYRDPAASPDSLQPYWQQFIEWSSTDHMINYCLDKDLTKL